MNPEKQKAIEAVETARKDLTEISLDIHSHPELAMREHHASKVLADRLEKYGFAVERGAHGLETAFEARWGEGPITIAYFCEYDALPEIGHACGHNLIATAGMGGAIGLKAAVSPDDVTLLVVGTPAEEDIGGKVALLMRGALKDIDVAMMAHPAPFDLEAPPMYGVEGCNVTYRGQAAHASVAPETGVNALDGLVTAYQAIAQLRQHIRRDSRVHGIITYGGSASNVIPDRAEARFAVRALQPDYLRDLKIRVEKCFEAGALASGASVDVRWDGVAYEPLNSNMPLAKAYRANAEALGRKFLDMEVASTGSTDMGNVSWAVPSIHPTFAIGGLAINHTSGFTEVCATDAAHNSMLQVAQALAMTGVDLVQNRALVDDVKAEFGRTRRA
jgi:amidohydrolase